MTLRVVIVDDERPARVRLRRLLAEHADLELVGEAEDAESAVELIDRERPDLCLLDVEMPEGDGFEVLRRIRHQPRVIFTTAYDRYAVPAFEVKSLDYLLKPVKRERFAEALQRARDAQRRGDAPPADIMRLLQEIRAGLPAAEEGNPTGDAPPTRIPARRGQRVMLLDPEEILWFEAEETIVFARTAEARLLVERTLGELEAQLGRAFFRAHRGYLVNISAIVEILPDDGAGQRIVMRDPERSAIPLSRRQARSLRTIIPW